MRYVVPENPKEISDLSSWDGFVKTLSKPQASILKDLLVAKTEPKQTLKPAPKPAHPPKIDLKTVSPQKEETPMSQQKEQTPKIKKEGRQEKGKQTSPFKLEPKVQMCKKEGCPMSKPPMGASYEAVQLIKKHHIICLKKKFDDSEHCESKVTVTLNQGNGAETSTSTSADLDERNKRKLSKPMKIPLSKDTEEEPLPLDTPNKKKKSSKTPLQSPMKLRSPWLSPAKDVPETKENITMQLEVIDWSKLFPNATGSYTVMVAGKPMKVIVQEDVPLSQLSPK